MQILRTRLLLFPALALLATSCQRAPRTFAGSIDTADPDSGRQLTSGFHAIERMGWRWTTREFSVALETPPDAERTGARIRLHFFIPDNHIEKLGPMTLSAQADGEDLAPETFRKGGSYVYSREIPRDVLRTNILPVNFCFDKALPPGKDARELGAVVTAVELTPAS